jgi:hypothetical protein
MESGFGLSIYSRSMCKQENRLWKIALISTQLKNKSSLVQNITQNKFNKFLICKIVKSITISSNLNK